jgi:orotate phosphoribosyltransferase
MSIAARIKAIAEIHGKFQLRSGVISNRYFDKYRFESDPALLNDITQNMVALIPAGTEVLCGLEMGGIPVVTMLSHHSLLPAAFIRKEPKEYSTCKYTEGTELATKRILLVEDVVSSGGALIDAAEMLRKDGINVETALCVIDRNSGGKELLKKQGITLISLLTVTDLDRV